ncbi:hypothetical protein CSOJ01_07510 [Colletotrichum sojae]|uniref:Uncharacterized protein n=1 Tax=Colletotrichum sojae TaxID=2175907 RepID=A0A8H6J8J3_9PEZI|nr:hypothetical protein CSOJ01_07510 [Colletotrichum sojae]
MDFVEFQFVWDRFFSNVIGARLYLHPATVPAPPVLMSSSESTASSNSSSISSSSATSSSTTTATTLSSSTSPSETSSCESSSTISSFTSSPSRTGTSSTSTSSTNTLTIPCPEFTSAFALQAFGSNQAADRNFLARSTTLDSGFQVALTAIDPLSGLNLRLLAGSTLTLADGSNLAMIGGPSDEGTEYTQFFFPSVQIASSEISGVQWEAQLCSARTDGTLTCVAKGDKDIFRVDESSGLRVSDAAFGGGLPQVTSRYALVPALPPG